MMLADDPIVWKTSRGGDLEITLRRQVSPPCNKAVLLTLTVENLRA